MLNKPIGHAFNLQARPRSRVLLITLDFVLIEGHELIARLREGERGVFLRFAKPRTPFCQFVKEALVGIIYTPTHVLTDLRVQVAPQSEPLRLSQFEDVLIHRIERDVFARQAVVTPLEGDEVIPHRRRNKQLMPQPPIFLVGAEKSVFVHLVNGDRIVHTFDALTSGGSWGYFLILNLPCYILFQQKKT